MNFGMTHERWIERMPSIVTGGVWNKFRISRSERSAYVPKAKWGRDHWSTFIYLVTRVECWHVPGVVNNEKMRCNPRIHREFAHRASFTSPREYPTRLHDGSEIDNHDDWSCLEDICAEGLMKLEWCQISDEPFGCAVARVSLTKKGEAIAARAKEWCAAGNSASKFRESTGDS